MLHHLNTCAFLLALHKTETSICYKIIYLHSLCFIFKKLRPSENCTNLQYTGPRLKGWCCTRASIADRSPQILPSIFGTLGWQSQAMVSSCHCNVWLLLVRHPLEVYSDYNQALRYAKIFQEHKCDSKRLSDLVAGFLVSIIVYPDSAHKKIYVFRQKLVYIRCIHPN